MEHNYRITCTDWQNDSGNWQRITIDINKSHLTCYGGDLHPLITEIFDLMLDMLCDKSPDPENLMDSSYTRRNLHADEDNSS